MCDFFFFQAEDGIRDLTVTGVQTCALPISPIPEESSSPLISPEESVAPPPAPEQTPSASPARSARISFVPPPLEGTISLGIFDANGKLEIGRASCRERV